MRGLETATGDPGEMAVLEDAGNKATWASAWMFRTETHPADVPKLFDAAAGELNTELLVWIYTQHARAYFDFRA